MKIFKTEIGSRFLMVTLNEKKYERMG